MKKHAYLIMAHGNWNLLKTLLHLLDDPRNDIYIHIDQKVQQFNFEKFKHICQRAQIHFTPKRINVKWGGSSQVKTELLLYKQASQKDHLYYHLISGVDLPLKTQDEIHDFFEHNNREYLVYFDEITRWDYERLSKYHFPKSWPSRITARLNRLQEVLRIDRIQQYNMDFRRGYNWCSLTQDAVLFLLSKESFIRRICKFSICADECYKQYILYNSPFRERIYHNKVGLPDDLREVDWIRRVGDSPHIYTIHDYDSLIASTKLFARKFDEETDSDIISKIATHVSRKGIL